MPDVRHGLLTTLKERLVPLNVSDEFKNAGIFVNRWQRIRYGPKTIISTGWRHTPIPDDYPIAEYFFPQASRSASAAVHPHYAVFPIMKSDQFSDTRAGTCQKTLDFHASSFDATASYAIPVRRASALPWASFPRSPHDAAAALRLTLPLAG